MKLSILIPTFNEARTIAQVLQDVAAAPIALEKEIIVVDDGSTDGTREILQSCPDLTDLTVIFHDRNTGKGAALRTGLAYATGEIFLIQDADLEYSPTDYPVLLGPILQNHADVVYGSRFLGGPHRVLFFWHYVANRILTLVSNMLSDLNLTDMETGYKAFRAEVFNAIRLQSDRFGFEPEITAKVARRGYRIYEVPIAYHGRDYAAGKKITWRDGLAALWHILKYNLLGNQKLNKTTPHRIVHHPSDRATPPK
ncbi:MAG: glycosyltransferase family 2 protein [Deltaproteobacteria bacterium]|nr:glycosyltransferase family 2 protein [Deltaproteobacteria bacterium]